ncbi:MAG: tRNA uridine(34) 5-carboxymethylaminomethyl modification radical SAM/GNAT enzyme Elp3 [Candidatus Dojkabacteria bacterium]
MNYNFEPEKYKKELKGILFDALNLEKFNKKKFEKIVRNYPKDGNKVFSKDQIIRGIEYLVQSDFVPEYQVVKCEELISKIRMKPTRSISGVTTVTVLTKPFACPGQCIFCPNDVRMPKSYIATEPGAQRALFNRFSPYLQVYGRLQAYKNNGHPIEKIELLILGGTWSYYTEKYKLWFIHECFRAMNDFSLLSAPSAEEDVTLDHTIKEELNNDINDTLRQKIGNKPYNQLIVSKEYKELFAKNIVDETEVSWEDLFKQQEINSHGIVRCVGLVLETRSDVINEKETLMMRQLGATKIQVGIQTLDDKISKMNKRGENKDQVAKAFEFLRAAGFKIHAHMMPNLYGATPEIDLKVYKELFDSLDFKPDELKIYPTSIIKHTELSDRWQEGKFIPYTTEELIKLLADMMEQTPEYCRITRVIRDIPSTEIESGNLTTNLREVVEHILKKDGRANPNIRAREIKGKQVSFADLKLDIIEYETKNTTEYFLQYITEQRQIAGFLRLSIPKENKENGITPELNNAAIIREIHVYGPSLNLGKDSSGQAQHLGLGTKLIERAKQMAKEKGFKKLAVISSIGTREYYEKRGFELGEFYQMAEID